METLQVAIIGAGGKMGAAIEQRLEGDEYAVIGVRRGDDLAAIEAADVTIVAVKPQSFTEELAADVGAHLSEHGLVASIMAGIQLRRMQDSLGTRRVVRMMPNLAVRAGQSLTAWYAEEGTIDEADVTTIEAMLSRWGTSIRLRDEAQFDAFTALAGSGPAYFYEMAADLERAACKHGFSAEEARMIALLVLVGAASVVNGDVSASELVRQVASKGGTTERALRVFRRWGLLRRLVGAAVDAATARSQELGRR